MDSNQLILRKSDDSADGDVRAVRITDWVVTKVGFQRVRDRVIENLFSGDASLLVRMQYYHFCRRHNVREALKFLESEFDEQKCGPYYALSFSEIFLSMGGKTEIVESLLTRPGFLSNSEKSRLVEILLLYSSSGVVNYMEQWIAEGGDDDTLMAYSQILVKLGRVSGLLYYRDWMSRNRKFDGHFRIRDILTIPSDVMLPVALDMLDIFILGKFDTKQLFGQHQELIETICISASGSEYWYSTVRSAFNNHIMISKAIILYHYINRLDELFFGTRVTGLNLRDAAKKVDAIFSP